jgi:hypothetical protein
MSSVKARPRWLFVFAPRWLAWHLFTVVAVLGMLWLGDWQFHRAEDGNALSWAYTFEWPIFAVMGVVFWAKTIIDEMKPKTVSEPAEVDLPAGAGPGSGPGSGMSRSVVSSYGESGETEDPELAAYNAYLARLNQQVQGHGKWHGLR